MRSSVARNPTAPPDVLAELAADDYFYVWEMVAGNPNTPEATLADLARHSNWGVRMKVAGNTKTPPAVLAQLSEDPEEWVLYYVAENPNTPEEPRKKAAACPIPEGYARFLDDWYNLVSDLESKISELGEL